MNEHLQTSDLSQTYPDGTVGLHPITLRVEGGEYFVLSGPSGAGKSTFLRRIAGLETGGGSISFGSTCLDPLPPHFRGITFVSQNAALYPHLDVFGNLAVGLELSQRQLPKRERLSKIESELRVREAASRIGLEDRLKARPHQLSGGEQKRVALGRGLVKRSPLWLLDEPFAQLDSPLAEKLSQELHLLQRQLGFTIIHVTHDPIEAMALADRVGLLVDGRILQAGTPSEVYDRPSSRTVCFYFGRPAINLIDGRSDGSTFVSAKGTWSVPCPHRGMVTWGVRPGGLRFHGEGSPVGTGRAIGRRLPDGRWLWTVTRNGEELRGFAEEPPDSNAAETIRVWRTGHAEHWFDASGNRIS